MKKKEAPSDKAALLQGTLDMLILQTLQWGPQHGHGIGQAIESRSGDLLSVEDRSIPPCTGWSARAGSRRHGSCRTTNSAKYYRLTVSGRRQLVVEESKWDLLVKAITRIRKPI